MIFHFSKKLYSKKSVNRIELVDVRVIFRGEQKWTLPGASWHQVERGIVMLQFCYSIFIRYLIAKIAWVAVIPALYRGIKHPEETSVRTIPLEALKRIRGLKCHEPSNALSILARSCISLSSFSLRTRKRVSNRVDWNWHDLTNGTFD